MFSKAIDNGGIGTLIAQNWQDLSRRARTLEFRRPPYRQRAVAVQHGRAVLRGGALLNGWKGVLLKDWTFINSLTLRTGNPLTDRRGRQSLGGDRNRRHRARPRRRHRHPDGSRPIPATASTSRLRGPGQRAPGERRGATSCRGRRFSPSTAPSAASSASASGAASIYGSTPQNALNHVTITSWGTTLASSTFGLPTAASADAPNERHYEVQVLTCRPITATFFWLWVTDRPRTAEQPAIPTGAVKFESNVQLVVVDVTVKDKSGNPIEGLTDKDFTITEDGKPQEIKVFKFQRLEEEARPVPALAPRPQPQNARKSLPSLP